MPIIKTQAQRDAYELLKASGRRVKPNLSDYKNPRDLVYRANQLVKLQGTKEFTTKSGDKTTTYTTYEESGNWSQEEAVEVAEAIIAFKNNGANRAQVSFKGRWERSEASYYGWRYGPMSTLQAATIVPANWEPEFEYVDTVRVYFAKNR